MEGVDYGKVPMASSGGFRCPRRWAAVGDSRPVWAVAGDGGFGQYAMEFTTAVKYGMPIKLVLLNNSEIGKISKEQRGAQVDVWATSLVNPNFADFASLCGGWGKRVSKEGDLRAALDEVASIDKPAILEVMTDVLKI